jgi:hypothetical protein
MQINYPTRKHVKSAQIIIYLSITLLTLSVIAGSIRSKDQASSSEIRRTPTPQITNLQGKDRAMPDKQKVYITATNLTKSLEVSSASYLDSEKFKKGPAGLAASAGISRDYLFKIQNISTNIIDAVIISFKQNGVLRETKCRYYKVIRNGLHPQEYDEIQAVGKELDLIPAIEAIIFRGGGFEGNSTLAEASIARIKTTDATINRIMTQFRERDLLLTENDSKIRENVNEMRILVNREYEMNRAKSDHRDILDFETHRGEYDGIRYIDISLKQLEGAIGQLGVRKFVNKVADRLNK